MRINTLTINGNTFEIADPAVEPLSQTVGRIDDKLTQYMDQTDREISDHTDRMGQLQQTVGQVDDKLTQYMDQTDREISDHSDQIGQLQQTIGQVDDKLTQYMDNTDREISDHSEQILQLQESSQAMGSEMLTVQDNINRIVDTQASCVLTSEQSLADEQQAQVRENLGIVQNYIIYGYLDDQENICLEPYDFEDILKAYKAGAYVAVRLRGKNDNHYYNFHLVDYRDYPLDDPLQRHVYFIGFDTDETRDFTGIRSIVLFADSNYKPRFENFSVKDDLDTSLTLQGCGADAYAVGQKLGDIETALDSIIAIQNSLTGGDSE